MKITKKTLNRGIWVLVILFLTANGVAYMHAYKFTHFNSKISERTKDPKDLPLFEKLGIVILGIDNPKPVAKSKPTLTFEKVVIPGNVSLGCWSIRSLAPYSKGKVIMFHGYAGEKSSLLGRANAFLDLGYDVLLVDFEGSGESSGTSTSIGYHESAQVKQCFEYFARLGEENIFMFGTSMGAVAILKAMDDYALIPKAIILECPFGSLYRTVCTRFSVMGVPSFPMAGLLTFWGGVQNGYWAFSHNPTEYANAVDCPALLMFGELDNRVSREETDQIFANLRGEKQLKTYPTEGHDVFSDNEKQWANDVSDFLSKRNVKD